MQSHGAPKVHTNPSRIRLVNRLREAVPRMTAAKLRRVKELLPLVFSTTNASDRPAIIDGYLARAGRAFEKDLHGAGKAIASALHIGSEDALRGLRRLLPGLMREVNRRPALAGVLAEAMTHAFYSVFHQATQTPNAVEQFGDLTLDDSATVTEAMRQWRQREVLPTDRGSAELRGLDGTIRDRAVFSAYTTNAEYLQEIAETVDDILAGKINMADGRWRLMKKLKVLGYDPAIGFPDDMENVPPAERDSLQDLSSKRRLDLVLETNVRMALGYAQVVAGNSDYARREYPAWELVRIYSRSIERGSPESQTKGWQSRWLDAGDAVGWQGAVQDPMVALKDSPIWQALGDGEGGYIDTLLHAYPPFAFRSGLGWRAVPRKEAVLLDLVSEDAVPDPASVTLTPGEEELSRVLDGLGEDFEAELAKELEEALA